MFGEALNNIQNCDLTIMHKSEERATKYLNTKT